MTTKISGAHVEPAFRRALQIHAHARVKVTATGPGPEFAPRLLSPAEVRVSLHELFSSVIGETDGKFAVLAITLDADNGPCAVGSVAHTLADERIGNAGRAPQAGLRG